MKQTITRSYIVVFLILCLISLSGFAADENNDIVKIQVLTINDFHGALVNNAKDPGAAKLGACLFLQKANYPDTTMILSAGDMFQGTMDSNLLFGATDIRFMNFVGFDAMALGNHEFDWKIAKIRERATQANFPFMAANIFDSKSKKPVDFCQPTLLIKRSGVTIGIIGYDTIDTPVTTSPANVVGLSFADPAANVQKLAAGLRARGAEIIIVLSHMGVNQDGDVLSGEAADFAKKVKGIDLIVSGHTHAIVNGKVNGIPIVQAYYNGRAVGDVIFEFSTKAHKITNTTVNVIGTESLQKMTPDTNIAKILDVDLATVSAVKNRVIGVAENTISDSLTYGVAAQTLMGEFVTDNMRISSKADMAFTNIGGLRTSIDKGNITLGNVYAVLPFDNTIVTCDMTGQQIMDLLNYSIDSAKVGSVQFSGLKIVYDSTKPQNQRIVSVKTLDGKPLDISKTYRVATNDFLAIGGDGYIMFKAAKNIINTGITIRDSVDNEIIVRKSINIVDDGRLQVIK
ncbi:MAG: 5'-nucleotidase C-terminal domain-containing protein [Negativicutes bacterium]|jgi:2',3'-cyclic-nucleotide 2'-phosphodiesterase/3'-nucleotidase